MAPKAKQKPIARLIGVVLAHSEPLFWLLIVAGLLGPFFLPLVERRIKFEEKSLLLGAAHATFRQSKEALQMGVAVAEAAHQASYQQARTAGNESALVQLLTSQLEGLGLEVYESSAGCTSLHEFCCTNLHAILRSPLGDGKESLVIVTSMNLTTGHIPGARGLAPPGSPLQLAAAAGLMRHLQGAKWLAKDVIWVLPDAACGGALHALSHWVHIYQDEGQAGNGRAQPQFGRAGVMQQAIVLEADRVTPSRLEVAAVGWAGQLPKLDMVHLLQQASFTLQGVTLQPSWEVLRWPTAVGDWLASKLPVSQQSAAVRAYASKLSHLFGFMRQQAIGVPTGPHAAFKEYMVDAATAKLYGPGKVAPSATVGPDGPIPRLHPDLPSRATQVAEFLELSVRSLNNLDERFHHSYFLYLLTSLANFVTVEMYIIPLVLLISALLLKAAGMRRQLQSRAAGQQHVVEAGSPEADEHKQLVQEAASADATEVGSQHATAIWWPGAMWDAALLLAGCTACAAIVQPILCKLSPAVLQQVSLSHQGSSWVGQDFGKQVAAMLASLAAGAGAFKLGSGVRQRGSYVSAAASTQAAKPSALCMHQQWAARQVVVLSWCGMVLTAMASLNWAAAYAGAAACIAVVSIAAAVQGHPLQGKRQQGFLGRAVRVALVFGTCPLILPILQVYGSQHAAEAAILQALCSASPHAAALLWACVLPCWLLQVAAIYYIA